MKPASMGDCLLAMHLLYLDIHSTIHANEARVCGCVTLYGQEWPGSVTRRLDLALPHGRGRV